MTKRLVDVDDTLLEEARAELGTRTIKDTVNEALRMATQRRLHQVARSLDLLAQAEIGDRAEAWR